MAVLPFLIGLNCGRSPVKVSVEPPQKPLYYPELSDDQVLREVTYYKELLTPPVGTSRDVIESVYIEERSKGRVREYSNYTYASKDNVSCTLYPPGAGRIFTISLRIEYSNDCVRKVDLEHVEETFGLKKDFIANSRRILYEYEKAYDYYKEPLSKRPWK
jgi:hypothetical protein